MYMIFYYDIQIIIQTAMSDVLWQWRQHAPSASKYGVRFIDGDTVSPIKILKNFAEATNNRLFVVEAS